MNGATLTVAEARAELRRWLTSPRGRTLAPEDAWQAVYQMTKDRVREEVRAGTVEHMLARPAPGPPGPAPAAAEPPYFRGRRGRRAAN